MASASTEQINLVRDKFEPNLEVLRGFAALIVVISHTLYHRNSLDPSYSPAAVWTNALPAHLSVLIFFILSGYVIGLTNKRALTRQTFGSYLHKRIVRLYPIYIISLLYTLLIITHSYAPSTLIGHFFFLQNGVVPVIFENNPLWSLNNEVLYYLIFIPISYFRIIPSHACAAAAALGLLAGTVLSMPLLSSYCIGFVFWSSGLWLAQQSTFSFHNPSRWFCTGLLCLFIGYGLLNPFTTVALKLLAHLNPSPHSLPGPGISISDLVELPFCFYLFLRFTNRSFRGSILLLLFFIVSGLAYFAHILHKYGLHSSQVAGLWVPLAFFLLGTAMVAFTHRSSIRTSSIALPKLAVKLGAISYGIYVIHFPISLTLAKIHFLSGSATSFSLRLLLDLLLVLGIAHILELKIQPWFKHWLSSRQNTSKVLAP